MTSNPTSDLPHEQAQMQVGGEQRRLADLWRECQALKAELEGREPDRRALRRVEIRVNRLCHSVSQHVRAYSRLRGSTAEGEAVCSSLAISRHDLAWLKTHRRAAPDRQITERLGHALRASSNALALLRWSWSSADPGYYTS